MPVRIQRSRAKGWRAPEGAVNVGRPGRWGNPHRVAELLDFMEPRVPVRKRDAHEVAVALYREWLLTRAGQEIIVAARRELRGRDLMCWCPLDQPCHADVLLEIANAP